MRVYTGKEEKSWSVRLDSDYNQFCLQAVDTHSGKLLATLLEFNCVGKVTALWGAKKFLEDFGYDPHEHKNEFDEHGRLIVTYNTYEHLNK